MIALALITARAATAAAEEPPVTSAPLAKTARSLFSGAQPTFVVRAVAPSAATLDQAAPAQAPAATTTTTGNEHQFGAGIRAGGVAFGFGGSVRYFFYGGALGVQGEVAHYPLGIGNDDLGIPSESWSAIQFAPSAIYRFSDQKFAGPAHLTPYVGAGLSFVHVEFGETQDFFESLVPDDTSVGILLYGGVELFFDKFPNLSFSGELSFMSNHEDLNADTSSLPWPSFVAAAHWYFW